MLLAAALGLQNFRHFVGGGIGGILLEVAGNGEDGVAHANLGHTVRAAGRGEDLLAGGVGHRLLMLNRYINPFLIVLFGTPKIDAVCGKKIIPRENG